MYDEIKAFVALNVAVVDDVTPTVILDENLLPCQCVRLGADAPRWLSKAQTFARHRPAPDDHPCTRVYGAR